MQWPQLYKTELDRCVIQVDGKAYDCTTWRHSHPGGCELIDRFNGMDATDAFYAFHSKDAIRQLQKMRNVPAEIVKQDQVTINFQEFRKRLEAEGYLTRNWLLDFTFNIAPMLMLAVAGTALAWTYPVIATLLLGVAWQQVGWLGHDYMHGRGSASLMLGYLFGGCFNGFSSAWWNHKHNTHHAFPNRFGVDADIHNEPILHLWFPEKGKDAWFRRYQHIYYPLVYSLLYASWRMQSIQFVLSSKNWTERALIVVNYAFLFALPWKVALGSVIVGGFLVAIVVTANHQTEEILPAEAKYHFVVDQFRTTRGVICSDPVTEFIFGGMQYQLEHHLFPTMPRVYFPKVRKLIEEFGKQNGMQYHMSGVVEILKLNYDVMKKHAQES